MLLPEGEEVCDLHQGAGLGGDQSNCDDDTLCDECIVTDSVEFKKFSSSLTQV